MTLKWPPRQRAQARAEGGDLGLGDAAVLPVAGRAVLRPCTRDLLVAEERIGLGVHVFVVARQGAGTAAQDVEERDVVVAGHHHPRRGQAVQEGARGRELRAGGRAG